jgi:hypothetical protein
MNPRQPCVVEPKSGPGVRPTLSELSTIKVLSRLSRGHPRPVPKANRKFLPSFHVSRITFHSNVIPKLHFFRAVSALFSKEVFHDSLSHNHLQSHNPNTAQFLACRAEALGEGGLPLLAAPACRDGASERRREHQREGGPSNVASASRRCPPPFNRGNAQRSPWPILTPLPHHPRSVGILPTFRQPTANLCQPAPTCGRHKRQIIFCFALFP